MQEVYAPDNPRLSISGWFHGPDPPPGADLASLKQIMTKGDDLRPFSAFTHTSATETETAQPHRKKPRGISIGKGKAKSNKSGIPGEDLAVLSEWINPMYLEAAAIKNINKQFCVDSSIQLRDFLRADLAIRLSAMIKQADEADSLGKQPARSSYPQPRMDHHSPLPIPLSLQETAGCPAAISWALLQAQDVSGGA